MSLLQYCDSVSLSESSQVCLFSKLYFWHHLQPRLQSIEKCLRVAAYTQDKNNSEKLCAKIAGGAYARGGTYLRDTTVHSLWLRVWFLCHRGCVCTCNDHELWTMWAGFCLNRQSLGAMLAHTRMHIKWAFVPSCHWPCTQHKQH